MPPKIILRKWSIDHRLPFMYLPLDIFRRFTNIESLVVDEHKKKNKGRSPPKFVLSKTIEHYHSKLKQLDYDWEKSTLKHLDFIWPNAEEKINAAIWSLSKEDITAIHDKATEFQKNFIYLPLHLFQQATNIYLLVREFEESRGNGQADRTVVDQHVVQIHKRVFEVESWPPFLTGLKFLNEPDWLKPQTDRLSKKRKGNLNEREESAKQARILQEAKCARKASPPQVKEEELRPTLSNLEVKSSASNETLGEQASQVGISNEREKSGSPLCKQKRIPLEAKCARKTSPLQVKEEEIRPTLSNLEVKASASNETLGKQASQVPATSSEHKKQARPPPEPSEFQAEIIALSFEDFVKKTNIKELVAGDFAKQFNGTREMTPEAMEFGLNEYSRLRNKYDKWHVNSLKNLKYKECECKRKRSFADKEMQTVGVDLQNKGVQYSSLDFNGNESLESECKRKSTFADKEMQTVGAYLQDKAVQYSSLDFNGNESLMSEEDSRQSKMALLTVNVLSDSQIISMQHDLQSHGSQNPDEVDANITDDATVNDTKGNTEPIQVIPVTEAPTEEDINLDSSQTVADNDAIVDKASIDNSTLEASNEFNASGIENVNPQMANVQKKFQRFKKKKNPRYGVRKILEEIGQQFETLRPPTSELNRKVEFCLALTRRV